MLRRRPSRAHPDPSARFGRCDLLQNGALHVEKLLGTAKPSFLRVHPAGISLLVFSSDIK